MTQRGPGAVLLAVLLAACAAPGQAGAGPVAAGTAAAAAMASTAPVAVTITESAYGRVALRAWPDAHCIVTVRVPPPALGDLPPRSVSGTAGADGTLVLGYDTPHLPKGSGTHDVSCAGAAGATATADFALPDAPIKASGFTARIRTGGPEEHVDKTTVRVEPSLVPLRDTDVAALGRTVAAEWSDATRGLGRLAIAPATTADIVITVLAARGTSVHLRANDGSEAIYLYAADDRGPLTPDNFVAVALHELGHIWCCTGPDAGTDGHWAAAVADPLLQGVDRFGLMNHPVLCVIFGGGVESCPNRFSERELRTMGFTAIPAPPRNACVDTKNALKAQLAGQDGAVKAGNAAQDALLAQVKAIEAQYPSRVLPPDVYTRYNALVAQYNAGVPVQQQRVAEYNALVARINALVC